MFIRFTSREQQQLIPKSKPNYKNYPKNLVSNNALLLEYTIVRVNFGQQTFVVLVFSEKR